MPNILCNMNEFQMIFSPLFSSLLSLCFVYMLIYLLLAWFGLAVGTSVVKRIHYFFVYFESWPRLLVEFTLCRDLKTLTTILILINFHLLSIVFHVEKVKQKKRWVDNRVENRAEWRDLKIRSKSCWQIDSCELIVFQCGKKHMYNIYKHIAEIYCKNIKRAQQTWTFCFTSCLSQFLWFFDFSRSWWEAQLFSFFLFSLQFLQFPFVLRYKWFQELRQWVVFSLHLKRARR